MLEMLNGLEEAPYAGLFSSIGVRWWSIDVQSEVNSSAGQRSAYLDPKEQLGYQRCKLLWIELNHMDYFLLLIVGATDKRNNLLSNIHRALLTGNKKKC